MPRLRRTVLRGVETGRSKKAGGIEGTRSQGISAQAQKSSKAETDSGVRIRSFGVFWSTICGQPDAELDDMEARLVPDALLIERSEALPNS